MIPSDALILVTGASGLVGGAIVRALRARGHTRVVAPTRAEMDLTDAQAVDAVFRIAPDYVCLAGAKVGGIAANVAAPVEFLADNLSATVNALRAFHRFAKPDAVCVFLGSSCAYPRLCAQPMRECDIGSGPLEPTNEGYALAKLAGLRLSGAYVKQYSRRIVCPMPCNLYGTGDHFDPHRAHVLSSLVRRFMDAADVGVPEVTCWGTGTPRREFLHVDDCAAAVLLLMDRADVTADAAPINVGSGVDHTIADLASWIAEAAGYRGTIRWDTTKPDGMPRKLLDVSRVRALGFTPMIDIRTGIARTVAEYRATRVLA